MNKFWNISPKVGENVLDMYVYGDIVTDSGFFGSEDDVVTREFIKDLRRNPSVRRINVHINSGGGEVFAAFAIAQQLKNHPAEVHTYVDGLAASAATIIAMAGDVRHMSPSSLYMIHLPSSGVRGNKHDMAKGIEILEKVEDAIRMTYANKCTIDSEKLTELIDHESWLTADEALEYGFIDEIDKAKDADTLIKNIQDDLLDLNGVIINVAAYAEPDKLRSKLMEIRNSKNITGGVTMDFQEFLNTLPEASRTMIENHVKEVVHNGTEALNAQVNELTTQVEQLTNQLNTANSELEEMTGELQKTKNALDASEANVSAEAADQKFLDSLPEEAKQAILDARAAAAEATAALITLKDQKAFEEFKAHVAEYGNLPIQDAHVKALYNLSKACPEDFAEIEALFNAANNGMQQNFDQLGSDAGATAPTDAYETIEKLVADEMKNNDALDYNSAFNNVILNNPELYNKYRQGL